MWAAFFVFGNLLSGGLACSAHSERVYFYGWLADAYRDGLASLAAGANAVIHCEIIADHRTLIEGGRAVADQRGILDGCADFTVLDEIGFGALEDEIA